MANPERGHLYEIGPERWGSVLVRCCVDDTMHAFSAKAIALEWERVSP